MNDQKYHLYAIRTADLTQGALKGFQYSLQANNRYCLLFAQEELQQPFRKLPDNIQLTDDERAWKQDCERKITEDKVKTNVAYMQEHEDEYSGFLMEFVGALEKELAEESKKVGEKK